MSKLGVKAREYVVGKIFMEVLRPRMIGADLSLEYFPVWLSIGYWSKKCVLDKTTVLDTYTHAHYYSDDQLLLL